MRLGSKGAGKCGTRGEDVASEAVEAVDRAGEVGTRRPSCAGARGGKGVDKVCEDVVAGI